MKKILFFIIFFAFFQIDFAWEKINWQDEFGDYTSRYSLMQRLTGEEGALFVGATKDGESIAFIKFPDMNIRRETDVVLKVKSKSGIDEIACSAKGENLVVYEKDVKKFIRLIRDNNILKFNLNGINFSLDCKGFTKLYKKSYWQKFNDSLKVEIPPKGEKTYSLVEGQGEIEKQDDIWYHDIWLK